jgi:hypothetical protein
LTVRGGRNRRDKKSLSKNKRFSESCLSSVFVRAFADDAQIPENGPELTEMQKNQLLNG